MPILFKNVGYEWPNGHLIFNNLNFSLEHKIYGLVGANGAGKTTLARLISGDLDPTSGSISNTDQERVQFFQQSETPPKITISEYLSEASRAYDPFQTAFLKGLSDKRLCSSLSGGEWARVRLAKVGSSDSTFLILDEPTNHLDCSGRKAVHEFLDRFRGGVLIISHDREILEKADKILELTSNGLSVFGGSWSEYSTRREKERARLGLDLEKAKKRRKDRQRSRQQKMERQAKRQKQGKLNAPTSGLPKILLGARKRAAQVSQGKIDRTTMNEVDDAVAEAWDAFQKLKIDPVMYARLPEVSLPPGKMVIEAKEFNFRFAGAHRNLWPTDLTFSFRGPARIAIQGPNGSGKSTLLHLLKKEKLSGSSKGSLQIGSVRATFLDQDYSMLNKELSVIENIQEAAKLPESELRSLLAMFLFTGEKVHQQVSELSGGEVLRVALAQVLLSNPPANVLCLDEPTNNLDIPNIEFLEELLKQYKGALIVVSHDAKFLERLGLTDEIVFD